MSSLKKIDKFLQSYEINIEELTEQKIIRIEKELKAKMKLEGGVDVNEIETIVSMLKEKGKELSILNRPELKELKKILLNTNRFSTFKPFTLELNFDADSFKVFLAENFHDDLSTYIDNCFKQDHFWALNCLLYFKDVLPENLVDSIRHKVGQKLEYAFELSRIGKYDFEKKLRFVLNPFFYRSMGPLGAINFHSEFVDLYNQLIEKKPKKGLFARFLLASSNYPSMMGNLTEILKENKRNAVNMGAREFIDEDYTGTYKGSTYMRSGSLNEGTSSGGGGKGVFGAMGGIGIVIVLVLKIALFSTRNSSSNDIDFSFNKFQNKFNESLTEMVADQEIDIETVMYNQYNEEGLEFTDIDFDISETNFREYQLGSSTEEMDIQNLTLKPMIVIVAPFKLTEHIFLKPGETKSIQSRTKHLRIYTGNSPQTASQYNKYLDSETKVFRFGEFTKQDSITLETDYEVDKMLSILKYTVQIFENESGEIEIESVNETTKV